MISRRQALTLIGAGAVSIPFATRAQSAHRMPRLGIVHPASVEASQVYKALVLGLAERGFVDGKSITLELRSGNGKPEALPSLVDDLVRSNVDILLVVGPAAVKAAMSATQTIPIVAIDLESDPVQSGWVKSLSRPGGNVTGFFLDTTAMSAKWLQLLREAVPGARRISLLWDATSGTSQLTATRKAAATFGIEVQTVTIKNWTDFDAALDAAVRASTQAFVVLSSPTAFQYSARFAEFTLRNRMPAISPFQPFVPAGGLMSYGPNLDLFFKRVAVTIERILLGARAGDVAAEQPTKYELAINLQTAKALGVTIPQSMLLRADEVIQ